MRWIAVMLMVAALPLEAEKRMDAKDRYERLVLIVPLVGSGTRDDPRRPMFVPARPGASPGLISFHYDVSDDAKTAIVELVAADANAFAPVLSASQGRADVKAFERGKSTKAEVEQEIKKVKKDFDVDKLGRRGK